MFPSNIVPLEAVKSFASKNKQVCILALGVALAIYAAGKLAGRMVAWMHEYRGTTKKTDDTGYTTLEFSHPSLLGSILSSVDYELSQSDLQLEAQELSTALNREQKTISMLDLYTNSRPVFENLILALEKYAVNEDVSQFIDERSTNGQRSTLQRSTVGETFANAKLSVPGGFQQTMNAMKLDIDKGYKKYENLYQIGLKIDQFITKLPI